MSLSARRMWSLIRWWNNRFKKIAIARERREARRRELARAQERIMREQPYAKIKRPKITDRFFQ